MNKQQSLEREENHVIYLDNAATTFPKPAVVYTEANEFYSRYGGNAGRGGNPLARAATRLLGEARALLADLLAAPSEEQVIFTASATHALNQAILGMTLRAGDVIYVSPFEHNSVLRPVEHLRQTRGIQVRSIPFSSRTYTCQLDKLAVAFQSEPPSVVCITQASNVCGIMPPIQEIALLAKQANPKAVIIVDGAQTAGLYPLDLKNNLIDAFIFSGHKSLYGPYGVAGFVLGTTWRPSPLLFGGTGTISESIEMPTNLPTAYEAGSHNIWAIAGLHASLTWLRQYKSEEITQHSLMLANRLRKELASSPMITTYAPPEAIPWCGIISLTIEGISPQSVEAALGAKDIAVRAGIHCAPWTHQWLGTLQEGGTVRISPGYFNTITDLEVFLTSAQSLGE